MAPFRTINARNWLIAAGLFTFAPGATNAQATIGPTLARQMPGGAVAFAELRSVDRVIEQFRDSTYYKLVLDSPQFQAATRAANFRKAMAARQLAETQLGMDVWTAASKLLGGQLALALYPKPNTNQPDAVFMLRVRDSQAFAKIKQRFEPLLVLAEDQLKSRDGEGGVRHFETADGKAFSAWGADWFASATNKTLMAKTVDLIAGKNGNALADESSFVAMSRAMSGEHLAVGYLNTAMIRKVAGNPASPQKLDNPVGSLLISGELELALKSPYVGLALDWTDGRVALSAAVSGDVRKLPEPFRPFFSDPTSSGIPAIPQLQGLVGVFSFHRDFTAWYRQREQYLQEQVLPGFDKFESGLANLMPGKNFGEDVLPLLGKSLTLVAARQDYGHLDGKPGVQLPGFALIVSMAKPDEAAGIFKLLFQTISAISNFSAGEQGRQPTVMDLENYKGVTISYGKYLQKPKGDRLPIAVNFTPAACQIANSYCISSSVDLCRKLIDAHQSANRGQQPNRNLLLELRAEPSCDLIEANRELFVARLIQDGRTAKRAADEFAILVGILRRFDAIRLFTGAKSDSYEAVFEITYKK